MKKISEKNAPSQKYADALVLGLYTRSLEKNHDGGRAWGWKEPANYWRCLIRREIRYPMLQVWMESHNVRRNHIQPKLHPQTHLFKSAGDLNGETSSVSFPPAPQFSKNQRGMVGSLRDLRVFFLSGSCLSFRHASVRLGGWTLRSRIPSARPPWGERSQTGRNKMLIAHRSSENHSLRSFHQLWRAVESTSDLLRFEGKKDPWFKIPQPRHQILCIWRNVVARRMTPPITRMKSYNRNKELMLIILHIALYFIWHRRWVRRGFFRLGVGMIHHRPLSRRIHHTLPLLFRSPAGAHPLPTKRTPRIRRRTPVTWQRPLPTTHAVPRSRLNIFFLLSSSPRCFSA